MLVSGIPLPPTEREERQQQSWEGVGRHRYSSPPKDITSLGEKRVVWWPSLPDRVLPVLKGMWRLWVGIWEQETQARSLPSQRDFVLKARMAAAYAASQPACPALPGRQVVVAGGMCNAVPLLPVLGF